MERKIFTVREFAEQVGVSVQSIYKRLKNKQDEIQKFVIAKDKRYFIAAEAIEKIYKNKQENNSKQEDNDINIIAILREQLELKDKQIEELNRRLEEAQKSLNQQQQLMLLDKQKILMLEDKTEKKSIFSIFKRNKRSNV